MKVMTINTRMFIKHGICTFTMLCINFVLSAQQYPVNGTKTTQAFIDTLVKNLEEEKDFLADTTDVTLQLQFYKIANDSGIIKINNQQIQEQRNVLNNYFAPSFLQFQISNIDSIADYNFAIVDSFVLDELVSMYHKPNIINIYLVEELDYDTAQYGFTYLPAISDRDCVFLLEEYLTGNYLATLLGSYFGLLPTHEKKAGIEYVDGSNCNEAGDLICDTFADPDLKSSVKMDCTYSGYAADPHGTFYIPTVANIMSNSLDACKCKFTKDQHKRIRYNYWKYRNYLK